MLLIWYTPFGSDLVLIGSEVKKTSPQAGDAA